MPQARALTTHFASRFTCTALLGAATVAALILPAVADNIPQGIPYLQNWTDIGMITVNNDWSGVPGIVGYRGDDLTTSTGTDPQTLLADGTTTPINVIANQGNPNTLTTGGVGEFQISDPVVALQGSGTADAPFILLNLDTTQTTNIAISYNLRDIDGSTDNAIQPVALHYRIGNSGSWFNIPAAFVADATTGPSLATLVTPVLVGLPAAAWNQPLVQLRWMTSNAVGNDEWVGVDDINVFVFDGPDSDDDGVPDLLDNCVNTPNPDQADCDHDGLGNACDDPCLNDKDGDGIADKNDNCPNIYNPGQEDCQGNGIGDVCDIAAGLSFDCNLNGIPDECEADCNGNGIPDDCDLANGAPDKNNNGILDECESDIALVINEILYDPAVGAAGDANNDGVFSTADDEFIEFVNNHGTAIDISGWTVTDFFGIRHVFPNGTILQNQCGLVLFAGGNPTGQFGGMVVQKASTGGLGLNNNGDTITVRDNNGFFVTSYTYTDAGDVNKSITRDPDITGGFVLHPAPLLFSAGRRNDGSTFGGCSVLPDADNDGIPDASDNCVNTPNPSQADCDGDGIGDACDTDPDDNNNGIPDVCEVGPPKNMRLNEVRIDEPLADNNEYVEIKGTPGASLNGISLLVIGEGSISQGSGVVEHVTNLTGKVIPADGHFILVESTFALAAPAQQDMVVFGGNPGGLNFENGDNVTYLLVTNFTGASGVDLDTNDDGILDILPWSVVVDAVGLVKAAMPPAAGEDWAYGASLGFADVGPDTTFVPGHIYRCETAGTWTIGLFDPFASGAADTAGLANPACPAPACPADITGDNVVNVGDLLAVIQGWGACPVPPNPCNADIEPPGGNGLVNVADLLKIITSWGPCPN